MENALTLQMHNKFWWLNILLGILFIGTGFWFWFTPMETFVTLAIYFSIWMFVSGIFEIINAISASNHSKQWDFYLIGGIVDIVIGGVLMAHENLTIEILPMFMGFWFIFRAFLGIAMYYELKSGPKAVSAALLITALLSGIFGLIILANPVIGELSIVYMTAFAFMFIGVYRLILGIQQRKHR
tara:strand:- start:67 stop:618 length:552 start_codon:yes stop_codon:yes gene_type:complete